MKQVSLEAHSWLCVSDHGMNQIQCCVAMRLVAEPRTCLVLLDAIAVISQGFSRGSSTYRGVTAHPSGRWESRIGIPGSKHVYLGLFAQEAAAAQVSSARDRY